MAQAVTFWLPDLLNPQRIKEAGDAWKPASYPNLRRLLKKADRFPLGGFGLKAQRDFYQTACQLFHQPVTLPVAAVLASTQIQTFDPGAFWIKVDPVQLLPDRDTLVLMPGRVLEITESEAKALIDSFNQHFEQERVEIEYGSPTDWYIRVRQPVDLQTTPLEYVTYASIDAHGPEGHAASYWRQLLNEASMLFFNHPVNLKRREAGRPEINGLWLWGEGQFDPDKVDVRPHATVWSGHPYLQGMATLCRAGSEPFPASASEWLQMLKGEGHQLLMSDSVYGQLNESSLEEWLETLDWLEKWATALHLGVKTGKIGSLLLELGDGFRYHLKPAHLNYFWRFRNRI